MYSKTYKYILSIFILTMSACQTSTFEKEIAITEWQFKDAFGEEGWLEASVPGFVHLDLYENNLIEDPFYRANELEQQWIEKKEWIYEAPFHLDKETLSRNKHVLILDGIDTYADVFLNDSLVETTSNFFQKYELNVQHLLQTDNKLTFVFKPPIEVVDTLSKANSYQLPGGSRVYSRKPQFHFGWDWGPKFIGCGITKSPILKSYNEAFINDIYIKPLSVSDKLAKLEVQIELSDLPSEPLNIHFLNRVFPIELQHSKFTIDIEQPDLWWPNAYGNQHLYYFNFELRNSSGTIIDDKSQKFALREIQLIQENDTLGKGFKFNVNGKDVYAKGANWIPLDYFHTRIDSSDYRKALMDVKSANMNMLRVWGGGIYEQDYFYDLCDSLGILVWQDFMFACAMYPSDSSFFASVKIEAEQQVKRLRKHPSIALWCGNNENSEGWHRWGWKANRSTEEIDSIWAGYQDLFAKILPNTVDSLSLSEYWESSPLYGRGDPEHQYSGDAHYWGIWHDAEPFENFESKVPRFMSEYGFQSFPEIDAIDLFAQEEDHYFNSKVMRVHQKHPRGNALIQEYMLRDYKAPADFESFVYLSQVLQAEGMRTGMEAHRRAKPYNMGTLYWQFNDCWPVASWSSRDYYGNWKALHYTTKNTYEDLILSSTTENDSIRFYIVNDAMPDTELDLLIEHVDYDGNRLSSYGYDVSLKSNSSQLVQTIAGSDFLYIDSLENNSYLDIQLLKDGDRIARKLHHFVKPKNMNLPYTGISYKVDKDSTGFILEIFSDHFMKNVMINSLHDGRFEDNYFDLPAKELKRIRFHNTYPMEEFNTNNLSFFSVADTY